MANLDNKVVEDLPFPTLEELSHFLLNDKQGIIILFDARNSKFYSCHKLDFRPILKWRHR